MEVQSISTDFDNKEISCKPALKILTKDSFIFFLSLFILFSDDSFILAFLSQQSSNLAVIKAYNLGTSFGSILIFAVTLALSNGLTNRCAQAYGAKDPHLVGIYFHRGFQINLLVTLPLCLPGIFSYPIFIALGADEESAQLVQTLLRWKMVGFVALAIYFTWLSVLNGCDKFILPSIIQVVVSIFYIILANILIVQLELGIVGAGLSNSITWVTCLVFIYFYTKYRDPLPGVFFKPERESFTQRWDMFKYQVTIGAMSWFDVIANEVVSLLGSSIPAVQYDAFAVGNTLYSILQPVPFALNITTMTYVSNYMAESKPEVSKIFLKCGLFLGLTAAAILEVFLSFSKDNLIQAFLTNTESYDLAIQVFNLFLVRFPIDTVNIILNAGVKAVGQEKKGIIVIILTDYIMLVPLSYFLCFPFNMGVNGFVVASIIDVIFKVIGYSIIFARTNWEDQVKVVLEALAQKGKIVKELLLTDRETL